MAYAKLLGDTLTLLLFEGLRRAHILACEKEIAGEVPNPNNPGPDKIRSYLTKKNDSEDPKIVRPRTVYVYRVRYELPR